MIVSLDIGRGPRLDDPDNFRAFKIVAPKTMDRDALARALGTLGRPGEGETAWISEAALRTLANRPDDRAWHDQATSMIDYARRSGWIDAETGDIRAHIERV
jgi:hypothetical protein